ncbi:MULTISPECIES: hypothetical protein [Mannheimia]|uniref:hypothetical protein n=1 Tax=Mannheimia TaxID=75984 RepID=UPI00159F4EBA|nr:MULTISPECIES: hypothetical protein [Mannheimia]QLB43992.1 hypothetical protein HV561_04070 [Mannheimia pernigra]QTM01191.1 hypothetical protein GM698_06095 [Mannheimia sp. ZY171111]
MKYLRKAVISALLAYGITSNVFAGEVDKSAQFKRYEQAKLKLTYEGEVGNLLQLLANRLGVGYLTYKIDFKKPVSIKSGEFIRVSDLLDNIESQVPDLEIKFERIGENIFINAVSHKEPLKLRNEEFVSEVIFEDSTNTTNSTNSKSEVGEVIFEETESKEVKKAPTQAIQAAQEVSEVKKP